LTASDIILHKKFDAQLRISLLDHEDKGQDLKTVSKIHPKKKNSEKVKKNDKNESNSVVLCGAVFEAIKFESQTPI
jgi:hypothetical protein